MNKEEIIIDGGLLTHYTNENEYYEYDSLYYETLNYLDRLQQQCKKQKEVIDKAIEYLEEPNRDSFDYSKATLLDILKEVK